MLHNLKPLFIICVMVLCISWSWGTSVDCGYDYRGPGVTVKNVLVIHKEVYSRAGFKVINSKYKNDRGQLKLRYIVKGSRYIYDLEFRFLLTSESVNACGTLIDFKEPKEYDPAERNAYLEKFENAMNEVHPTIKKKIAAFSREAQPDGPADANNGRR